MTRLTLDRDSYVRALLEAYRLLPDTPSRPRPPDRTLARQLFDRKVPLETVQQAFLLTTARRFCRPPQAPPLPSIRSLYYFLPVIEELLKTPLPDGYETYLKRKLAPRK